ncbi:unnamed protein product [Lampetra planeri]
MDPLDASSLRGVATQQGDPGPPAIASSFASAASSGASEMPAELKQQAVVSIDSADPIADSQKLKTLKSSSARHRHLKLRVAARGTRRG